MYKINWDVATDSKNKRLGIGIIAWDYEGQVIAAKCPTICVRQEPGITKAQAALQVMEFNCKLGLQLDQIVYKFIDGLEHP
jgi:hypothetical protein